MYASNERVERANSCWSSNKDTDMAAPVSAHNLQRFLPYLFFEPGSDYLNIIIYKSNYYVN